MRTCLPLALLLAAVPAFAATPINETRPLSATGRVDIENLKGRIQVRAWERDEVRIEGSLGRGAEKLVVEGTRDRLEVRVRYPRNSRNTEASELLLMVPRRADLDIDSVAAQVDVQGVAPRTLSIDSVSGNVLVAAAPGKLDVETVSGDVSATVNSGEVDVQSVSGDLLLRGRLDGRISTESVSGDISVVVNGERLRSFKGTTVSGDLDVRTALAPAGDIRMQSVSGDLALTLPADASVRVSAESFSGTLRAPGVDVKRPKYGPGASFDTRYGAGSGQVRMETFSGNAVLRLD